MNDVNLTNFSQQNSRPKVKTSTLGRQQFRLALGPMGEADKADFEELVSTTMASTYKQALALVGNSHDAHEVVQETYLRAFRYIGGFRGDSSPTTWLHAITRNSAINFIVRRDHEAKRALAANPQDIEFYASNQRQTEIGHNQTDFTNESLDLSQGTQEGERGALMDKVFTAISNLPQKLRTVIELRDVQELSHRAIADQLGITEAAAKVRLHRARTKIREQVLGKGVESNSFATFSVSDLGELGQVQSDVVSLEVPLDLHI